MIPADQFIREFEALWNRSPLAHLQARVSFTEALRRTHERNPRRYAECNPVTREFFFAPQTLALPRAHRCGLIAHEIGHALHGAHDHSENDADQAARRAMGVRIGYDRRWPGKGLQRAMNPRRNPGDESLRRLERAAQLGSNPTEDDVNRYVAALKRAGALADLWALTLNQGGMKRTPTGWRWAKQDERILFGVGKTDWFDAEREGTQNIYYFVYRALGWDHADLYSLSAPRVRFNWGFHDAYSDTKRGSPRALALTGLQSVTTVTRENGPFYYEGYKRGIEWARAGRDPQNNSDAAWLDFLDDVSANGFRQNPRRRRNPQDEDLRRLTRDVVNDMSLRPRLAATLRRAPIDMVREWLTAWARGQNQPAQYFQWIARAEEPKIRDEATVIAHYYMLTTPHGGRMANCQTCSGKAEPSSMFCAQCEERERQRRARERRMNPGDDDLRALVRQVLANRDDVELWHRLLHAAKRHGLRVWASVGGFAHPLPPRPYRVSTVTFQPPWMGQGPGYVILSSVVHGGHIENYETSRVVGIELRPAGERMRNPLDDDLRRLERAAREGQPGARYRLLRAKQRAGGPSPWRAALKVEKRGRGVAATGEEMRRVSHLARELRRRYGIPATVEHPGYVNVQVAPGISLNAGYLDGPLQAYFVFDMDGQVCSPTFTSPGPQLLDEVQWLAGVALQMCVCSTHRDRQCITHGDDVPAWMQNLATMSHGFDGSTRALAEHHERLAEQRRPRRNPLSADEASLVMREAARDLIVGNGQSYLPRAAFLAGRAYGRASVVQNHGPIPIFGHPDAGYVQREAIRRVPAPPRSRRNPMDERTRRAEREGGPRYLVELSRRLRAEPTLENAVNLRLALESANDLDTLEFLYDTRAYFIARPGLLPGLADGQLVTASAGLQQRVAEAHGRGATWQDRNAFAEEVLHPLIDKVRVRHGLAPLYSDRRRRNPDEELRRLERAVRAGQAGAGGRLVRERRRRGLPRGGKALQRLATARRLTTPLSADYYDAFLRSYMEAALWSSTHFENEDDPHGESFERLGFGLDAFSDETVRQMGQDCEDFVRANWRDLQRLDPIRTGHDFWLTRNRHGAGFWDRGLGAVGDRLTRASRPYGEVNLYLGDDGRIYS